MEESRHRYAAEAAHLIARADARIARIEARRIHVAGLAAGLASVLREEFGASDVWLFGSLRHTWFRLDSDLDLAVSGVAPERIGVAWDRLLELSDVDVDLIDLDDCDAGLKAMILATGERLP